MRCSTYPFHCYTNPSTCHIPRETRTMNPQHADQATLAYLTAMTQKLLADITAYQATATNTGSLGLGPSTAPQESRPSSPGLDEEGQAADAHTARYPVGHFGPESGLTPAQAAEANRLLARANHLRPIRGRNAQQRYARRLGGIKVAVLSGRSRNTRWGRSMLGKRGGRVLAMHGLGHLRAIARLGGEAAKSARANKKAVAHWDKTGEVLPLEPHET